MRYNIKQRTRLELKAGIKSSLPRLRAAIALSYLLFRAAANKNECDYCKEVVEAGSTKSQIDDAILTEISRVYPGIDATLLNGNPLFTAQIEHIHVGLCLLFRLAKVSFRDGRALNCERTGGNRYAKRLSFTSNMLVLDLIISTFSREVQEQALISWLSNTPTSHTEFEDKVSIYLNTLIRSTVFKIRDAEDNEDYFQYESLIENAQEAPFEFNDSHEFVGPTRILNSYIGEKLDPWLEKRGATLSAKTSSNSIVSFENYVRLLTNMLDVESVESIEEPNNGPTFQPTNSSIDVESMKNFITALKTKPFLLLAGISGTGKSQKVKELAYMTCPNEDGLRDDATTPGNYCIIEVKPNWHDSTELLGYYSNLSGKYDITPFIHFAYKATKHPNVPFFVCLDEMNLAPVEQYFAEYLSVLETRTKQADSTIVTAELLKKEIFGQCELTRGTEELYNTPEEKEIITYLKNNGLRLPENLFVIGTVNMDDTTHQFSRKVIDRAFTIEMNGEDLSSMFSEENVKALCYTETPLALSALKPEFVKANEVLTDSRFAQYVEGIKEQVPGILNDINTVLKNTPFRISYRVQNEFILYMSSLILEGITDINAAVKNTALVILLEKILPRVQGDNKLLATADNSNVLKDLRKLVEEKLSGDDVAEDVHKEVLSKLDEMDLKLENSYFANFF